MMQALVRVHAWQSFLQRAWRRQPFQLALCLSIVVHLVFLSVRWDSEEIEKRRFNTPLSVVLVNASHQTKPLDAKKLAQADLQGGGSAEQLDATALHRARIGAEARLEKLERLQEQILAKLNTEQPELSTQKSGEEVHINLQVNSLEAELAKRLQSNSKGVRRKVFSGASTKTIAFAHYIDAMRHKIETYGSTFFPRANGRPLYGSLVIVVSLDPQGRIMNNAQGKDGLSIGSSSGNPELDRQAIAIVRASAPFGSFPPEMRNQIDILDWVSTFEFTRDGNDRLELHHTQK